MFKLHRQFKFRIAAIAAIALLIAQIGAMAHAYSHAPGAAPASLQQPVPGAAHDFCADCLSFAPVLSAAGTPSALPFVEPHGRAIGAQAGCSSLVDCHPHLAFRSRAPPATH